MLARFERDKPLSSFSTFGIGGPARYFFVASSLEDLQLALKYSYQNKIPFFILGKGSNSLFDDRGIDGLVILNKIGGCQQQEALCVVGAGYSFALLGVQTARRGWSGLEFASGIPASVGGAIYMNAGASGSETCQALKTVTYIDAEGNLQEFSKKQLHFAYRFSSFQNMKGAIAQACFELVPSEEARKKQLKIIDYRTKTQPYGERSVGCVFCNPSPLQSAGALIEQSGLKGFRIGGASVSALHANFIVNNHGATAQDVLALAAHVRQTVEQRTGICLEMEIRCVPYQI